MDKILSLDFETVRAQDLPEGCWDEKNVKTGNMGPEKARAKIDKVMATNPRLCNIVAYAAVEKPISIPFDIKGRSGVLGEDYSEEKYLVSAVAEMVSEAYQEGTPIVTFNGGSFDIPVLWNRVVAHRIKTPDFIWKELFLGYRLRTNAHIDLMRVLNNSSRPEKGFNLDFYLKYYGLGDKEDFDGSMVYDAWKDGEYEKIREYCLEDARKTAELFRRVQPWLSPFA